MPADNWHVNALGSIHSLSFTCRRCLEGLHQPRPLCSTAQQFYDIKETVLALTWLLCLGVQVPLVWRTQGGLNW